MMKNISNMKSQPKLIYKNVLDNHELVKQTRIANKPNLLPISQTYSNKQNQPIHQMVFTSIKPEEDLQLLSQSNSLKRNYLTQKAQNSQEYNQRILQFKKQENERRKSQFKSMKDKVKQIEENIKQIKMNIKNKEISQNQEPTEKIQILNFVTQVPPPSQLIQCSSQTFINGKNNKIMDHKYYISTIVLAFYEKNNTSFMQLCKNHLITSMKLLKMFKKIQKPKLCNIKQLHSTQKKTLVFDLDQTLIHCNQNCDIPCDVVLKITFPNGQFTKAGINIRPWAFECLKQLSEYYQIIIFTASHQCYANMVIDYLDPTGQYVSYRYFRDSCYKAPEGFYVKDLRIIDRSLQNVLLIDNAAYSYGFQIENGVPVIPFYDNKTDNELKHLVRYLKSLVELDLRNENMKNFRMNDYARFSDPMELINRLYNQYVYE